MGWEYQDMVQAEIVALKPTEVIQGGAAGADSLALLAALTLALPYRTFKADWKKYGKAAGPIRNQQMLDEKPDQVLAFRPSSGITKGTADMVGRATKAGIPVKIVTYEYHEAVSAKVTVTEYKNG